MRSALKKKSIRFKASAIVVLMGLLLSLLIYTGARGILLESFLRLEEESLKKDLDRVREAVEGELGQLRVTASDWSAWDDPYEYLRGTNPQFEETDLTALAMKNLQVNVMMLVASTTEVVFKKSINKEEVSDTTAESLASYISEHPTLLAHALSGAVQSGIVALPEGPLYLVVDDVTQSDGSGPPTGALIFGKFLDERIMTKLEKATRLSFDAFPYDAATVPGDVRIAKEKLSEGNHYAIISVSDQQVFAYEVIDDINGEPLLIIRIDLPRPIYAQGVSTIWFYISAIAIATLMASSIMALLLDRLIFSRLSRLRKDIESIDEAHYGSTRVYEGSEDELGIVAKALNRMIAAQAFSDAAEKEASRNAMIAKENLARSLEETVVVRTGELREEKARLLASINSLSFGFMIIDSSNTILIKNPALSNILETIEEPRVLSDISRMLPHVDIVGLCKQSIVENRIVEQKDIPFARKFLRVLCAPIVEQIQNSNLKRELQVIGNVILVEDVTEVKIAERSREEFFAVASHELRTPLTAIQGNAEMILDMYPDKIPATEVKEMLTDISHASRRLISIVNDFLEASRLEQGKIELSKELFDPDEIISKVIRDMTDMIKRKGLEIEYIPLPESSLVFADKDGTEHILMNLIGNALKFTKQGRITIAVRKDGSMLRFSVADTGSGISEHSQGLLFRKFQPAGDQALTRDVSKSSGLGLYICKLYTTAMGGEVGLEKSESGKGSTFFFTLPTSA